MSARSLERSDLIDVTFLQLHSILSGNLEGTNPEQVEEYLEPRLRQLKAIAEPFGKPSDASRKKVNGNSVTLADGVVLHVDNGEKPFILAISSEFQIDEIHSLVLFRSFLYNQGLPTDPDSDSAPRIAELLEGITPFYFSERLSLLRTYIPLFRARENPSDPFHASATSFLPKVLPDGVAFAKSLVAEYKRRTQEKLADNVMQDPKTASRWAKQSSKEQLVILEVLFWTMWGSVPCGGQIVEQIMTAAYDTNLGSVQRNANLLLDEEGAQLQQDIAALWILITVEVLELETMAEPGAIEISDTPANKDIYTSSPEALERIHLLVTSQKTNHFACTYLAWTFVLSRVALAAAQLKEVPDSYRPFLELIIPQMSQSYSSEREPAHIAMLKTSMDPNAGLFRLIATLLTTSPLFVTAAAWRTGSTATDPNAIAFRSVLKGLIIAVIELVPVELIPDFDALVDIWIALFGRSESKSVAAICSQYWQVDWHTGISRRAIFDVARSRFPIQFKPLIRLLRAMTAAGFLDTDPLSTTDHSQHDGAESEERSLCGRHVFYFLDKLSTYSQVVPLSACTGAHATYERQQERYSSSHSSAGLEYRNLRPIRLPGGSILPAGSSGRLLSGDGGEYTVVCWKHEHSGWRLILEVMRDFVTRQSMHFGSRGGMNNGRSGRQDNVQTMALTPEEIGLEMDGSVDEALITDILDLVRSLIQDNPLQAAQLMQSLEANESEDVQGMSESKSPDLVQLTTMILEEALSRSARGPKTAPPTQLITSAMSVLSAIVAIPRYSNRVWIYIRSTSTLFGSDKAPGVTPFTLAAERVTGHYTMTLALLQLVQQLFQEASLLIVPDDPHLRKLKDEVLLRAMRFVHTEIWVEHVGWKYAQLGDRFEIGRRISSLYVEVLKHTPPALEEGPFAKLSQAVLDSLLFKATTSTINPLVSALTSGSQMYATLCTSRRLGDGRRLVFLLESHLHLIRLILNWKLASQSSARPSLLEQALCARITGGVASHDSRRMKLDPIDALAAYVKERDVGLIVPLEATRVLSSLCMSLSSYQPSPTSLIGHLSNPEAVVTSMVRIVQHPYDDMSLRYAVWNFISLAMDREPALASLFVAGQFRTPGKGKGKEKEADSAPAPAKLINAMDVARDTLSNWSDLWEMNPQLLAAVVRFVDVVWQHGLEHKVIREELQKNTEFWEQISSLACAELGPLPDYETQTYVEVDGKRHSAHNEPVAAHAYRTAAKSHALHIIGLDVEIELQSNSGEPSANKPISLRQIEEKFKSEDDATDLLAEAAPNSYRPELYDQLSQLLQAEFPGVSLPQFQSQEPLTEREFGDGFAFSTSLLRSRLRAYQSGDDGMTDHADSAEKQLLSLNLNLALMHTQTALADSWQFLLQRAVPYLRGDGAIRSNLLTIASSISYDIGREDRQGNMAAAIHGTRLSFLLAILELAWFSTVAEKPDEVKTYIELADNVRNIILNENQSPLKSLLGNLAFPFHRPLLKLLYFCTRFARRLTSRPKALNADQRLQITLLIESTLSLVIDALRVVFVSARSRVDIELDGDMELLVAVFEQCTRPDVNPSSVQWLTRCQETDIIRASLDLFAHTDLVGLSDIPLLTAHKQPLYVPHLLLFHMCLSSIPAAAERSASDGLLAAYSNNFISAAISAGGIDVMLPELPGERSPAHYVYCSMLSIVSGVITAMGRHNHYFDAEACGFVQLYGEQISRALSWTIGDTITLAFLEEIEQVVHLFYSIAENAPSPPNTNPAVDKVLRLFSPLALHLLQQLNYAITHPNHLTSLFEPITVEERTLLEKDQAITDPMKKTLIAHVVHRLYRLSSNVLGTLISISRADDVLIGGQDTWSMNEARVVPHSKVVLGEPASIGTLLELGNCTLDLLRDLVNRPAGQSIIAVTSVHKTTRSGQTLDVKEGVAIGRRNLESVLIYAVTQLAMWLSKPEYDTVTNNEMETEDQPADLQHSRADSGKDRRPRTSTSLAERLRRGMTGEMAADLQSLLNKAKPIIAKSNTVLGKESVDLTQVLSAFLQERIVAPA